MNPDLEQLHPYPFEKLAKLKEGITPCNDLRHIALSVGEPKHDAPAFVLESLNKNISGVSSYPATKGSVELREACCNWATTRFNLPPLDPDNEVLPVNGTREALFAFAQTVVDRNASAAELFPAVVMPNPFYQIYEGAALLAGAEPVFMNCPAANNFLPVFSEISADIWERCQLLYLCSPGNPTGSIISLDLYREALQLAEKHDFVIAADECYSEIYPDEDKPPLGLLDACKQLGNHDYSRCVVFHSLSKRSNLPGLRSGFVAGDKKILRQFLKYRTYHGCAMPAHHQLASIAAWGDEQHVIHNRDLYRKKFSAVLEILSPIMNVARPEAGFYLWPEIPLSDKIRNEEDFARLLYTKQNVTVLPGSYLSRASSNTPVSTYENNPGKNRVRMALVATIEECIEAAERIYNFVGNPS
jgi:N-succinyldiaminopimelate aminotransferase